MLVEIVWWERVVNSDHELLGTSRRIDPFLNHWREFGQHVVLLKLVRGTAIIRRDNAGQLFNGRGYFGLGFVNKGNFLLVQNGRFILGDGTNRLEG